MIRKVCDIYQQHRKSGMPTVQIYRKYVYPVYPISLATFYNYLATPIGSKERELERTGRVQLSLFD